VVAIASFAWPAVAQEPGSVCADPRIRVDGELDRRWIDPIVRLCETLASMRDVDAAVRIRFVPAGDGVIAEATTSDGRTALRRVRSPDDLPLMVEALVTLPPTPEEPPRKQSGAPPSPPPPSPLAPGNERGVAIEAGGAVEARLSRAPTYISGGVVGHAGLVATDWIFSLLVRWEPLQSDPPGVSSGFEMDTIGAGFAVMRRVAQAEGLAFDAGVTAMLISETQSIQLGDQEIAGSQTDVRVGAAARTLIGTGAFRFAPELEAEISPARIRNNIRIDDALPKLPVWGVALGLGFVWTGQ
jgi:hypothetical protein